MLTAHLLICSCSRSLLRLAALACCSMLSLAVQPRCSMLTASLLTAHVLRLSVGAHARFHCSLLMVVLALVHTAQAHCSGWLLRITAHYSCSCSLSGSLLSAHAQYSCSCSLLRLRLSAHARYWCSCSLLRLSAQCSCSCSCPWSGLGSLTCSLLRLTAQAHCPLLVLMLYFCTNISALALISTCKCDVTSCWWCHWCQAASLYNTATGEKRQT